MTNAIAFAVLTEMVAAYEHTSSYEAVITELAAGIKAVLPGTRAEQLLGKAMSDLGAALQGTQAASPPATGT